MEIAGKTAVITGASRGVGRAAALALAKQGCSVLVNFNRAAKEAEQTAREAIELGVKAITCKADVADDQACRDMMKTAQSEFGRIDILINNAGYTEFISHDDLEAVDQKIWDRIFAVNVRGTFQCTRAVRNHMAASGGGEVVNITSVAGISSAGSSIPYCASKAAQISLTVSLARALAPSIRVNSVAPGFIESRWTINGLGEHYESAKQAMQDRAVLNAILRPDDIAEAILSIITGSDLMTGQTITCDAGLLIGPKMV
jgi:3-oxoacyl-[acyl-carrier protein] reductase